MRELVVVRWEGAAAQAASGVMESQNEERRQVSLEVERTP